MVGWIPYHSGRGSVQVNQPITHLPHDSFYCSVSVQFWGGRRIARDNRCGTLFFLPVLRIGLRLSPVTHCCGIIWLKIKCVLWKVWGRIYQWEFFLWSIRAGYFADGFWNLAKPQYAVKIAVLGSLGTWAHLHLILRPPLLSDVFWGECSWELGPGARL